MLIAVNFSDSPVDCGIRLPYHAFEYLGLPEKRVQVTDLLSDDRPQDWMLLADGTVKVSIKEFSGRIYKFKI